MVESFSDMSPRREELFNLAAQLIAQNLFAQVAYAHLNEDDLRRANYLAPEETMGDFVASIMHFGESLQEKAFENFCALTPPPTDAIEEASWNGQQLFSAEDEDAERLKILLLRVPSANRVEVQAQADMRTLCSEIFWKASGVVLENGFEGNIEEIRANTELAEAIIEMGIATSAKIHGKLCWSVTVHQLPGKVIRENGRPTSMIPSGFAHIYIDNEVANSLVTDWVFKHKKVLAALVLQLIIPTQRKYWSDLDDILRAVANEKYGKAELEANRINAPVRIDFYRKLLADTSVKPVEILYISRDIAETDWRTEGRRIDTAAGETNGEVTRFTVTKSGQNELMFSWVFSENRTELVTRNGITANEKVNFSVTRYAVVREHNGLLEFADDYDDMNQANWLTVPGSSRASEIAKFFRLIEIATTDDVLTKGKDAMREAERLGKVLAGTNSSVAFANTLRELQLAHYPALEILVNPGFNVDIYVDKLSPLPSDSSRWN